MLTLAIILTTASITTYGAIVIVRWFEFQRAIERMREQTSWGDVAFVCEEMRPARKLAEGGSPVSGRAVTGLVAHHDGEAFR